MKRTPRTLPEGLWDNTPDGENPKAGLIRDSYRALGIEQWNNDRISRLSLFMRCDPFVLCAIAGIFQRSKVINLWESGKWPPEIILHFAMLEKFVHERTFKSIQEPPPSCIIAASILAKKEEQPA